MDATYLDFHSLLWGSLLETFSGSIPTRDGGFLGFGRSASNDGHIPPHPVGGTNGKALVTKHDSLGILQWAKVYGGSGYDLALAATQTADGGFVIAGVTVSTDGDIPNRIDPNPTCNGDTWVFKTDSSGNLIWSKVYGSTNQTDQPGSVIETADGGLLVLIATGGHDSDAVGKIVPFSVETDWLLIKTDVQGNRQWRRIIGGTADEFINSYLLKAPGGGYFIVGTSNSHNHDLQEDNLWPGGVAPIAGPVFLRLSDSGQVQWCKRYGGSLGTNVTGAWLDSASGIITAVGSTYANNYYLTGNHSTPGGAPAIDGYVMRVDTAGNFLTAKLYGKSGDDIAYSYGRRSDGFALLGCQVDGNGITHTDVMYYVLSPNGDSVTQLLLASPGNDFPNGGIYWRGGVWAVAGTLNSGRFPGAAAAGSHPQGNLYVSRLEQWPLSIGEVPLSDHNQIILIPNPTDGEVTCELPEAMTGTLTVLGSDERTVLRETLGRDSRVRFSVARWLSGNYLVTVVDNAGNRLPSSILVVR